MKTMEVANSLVGGGLRLEKPPGKKHALDCPRLIRNQAFFRLGKLGQPKFFTLFLPGWIINVATIVHSDEALLATAFIFTVHFFNTHFRPDKFPMDTVIFTGRVPLEELRQNRPREYEALIKSLQIKKHLTPPLPSIVVRTIKIFGATALVIGISLILLIIYAEIFGYR